jgi:NodT family efflux transporter outer membrane factor (OMF) lipoprotein
MKAMPPFARLTRTALTALLLAGCAVGPDFKAPAPPVAEGFTPDPVAPQTVFSEGLGGGVQHFDANRPVATDWWRAFGSPALDDLITAAFAKNPNLEAAKAAFRAAEETRAAGEGAYYPSLSGSVTTMREKTSGVSAGVPGTSLTSFSLYNTGVTVSYPLDVFGGTRRKVEELTAQAESERLALEAARLTLAGNIATAAIQEAGLRAQIDATKEIIATEEKQRDLLKRQLELGAVTKAALLAEEATLAATRAGLPSLYMQLAQNRHLLATLAGEVPSAKVEATFELGHLHLPEALPLTIPSKLVAQRPDIKAVEAQLHAASAAIGVAEAARYPQITLSGSFGLDALQIAQLFNTGAAAWSIGGSLVQPLFEGGALEHKQRAAEAGYDETLATYKGTVLSAFKEVANVLRALESDAETLRARHEAVRVAKESLDLAQEQFKAGSVSYLTLLNAEQTWQQARIALTQAQTQRFADTATLFVALGGGFSDGDQK